MTNPDIARDACDVCGRHRPLYVSALAGIPMSIARCRECLAEWSAVPYGIALVNTALIGGMENAADWWKDAYTYIDGRYRRMVDAFPIGSQEVADAIRELDEFFPDDEEEPSYDAYV
jgi:hypothetical protein